MDDVATLEMPNLYRFILRHLAKIDSCIMTYWMILTLLTCDRAHRSEVTQIVELDMSPNRKITSRRTTQPNPSHCP